MRAGDDENAALRRQSLLIAIGCVIADGAPFLLNVTQHPPHPAIWVAGLAILLADLALALPARTAGPVAVAHAVVRVAVAAVLLAVIGDRDGIGNATGLVVAGYRAGAWVEGQCRSDRGVWAGQVRCGWGGVTGDPIGRAFDAVGVVAGAFDDAGAGPVSAGRVGLVADLGERVGQGLGKVLRG
ncbi:hypothetical protein [Micromonospora sp. NBC_01813]|uniref:hypothetical protein n=1 Tax=Micromonospora sp. NBC_01813 TaxID=2975988 RepID=UPI002DD7D941|nr:hypothetical protein [Micromonospora sp. NBC_01813]WSA07964.1 hypothetical protein OG958_27730 [Micromonospora sp. NBC_01813]